MADSVVPHFQNDAGARKICIGVAEFKCMGASPPYDHPHVFLDMGGESEIICPYCSTVYALDTSLGAEESDPPGCIHRENAAA